MRFYERNCDFLSKTAKSSNFTLQCDWKSKKSQNFLVFGAFKKNRWIFFRENPNFFRKNLSFSRNAKDNEFAVQCDWISKISQRVQNLRFCWKQIRCVIRRNFSFQNRCNKFAVDCHWISKNLQKVRKFGVLKKWVFC